MTFDRKFRLSIGKKSLQNQFFLFICVTDGNPLKFRAFPAFTGNPLYIIIIFISLLKHTCLCQRLPVCRTVPVTFKVKDEVIKVHLFNVNQQKQHNTFTPGYSFINPLLGIFVTATETKESILSNNYRLTTTATTSVQKKNNDVFFVSSEFLLFMVFVYFYWYRYKNTFLSTCSSNCESILESVLNYRCSFFSVSVQKHAGSFVSKLR